MHADPAPARRTLFGGSEPLGARSLESLALGVGSVAFVISALVAMLAFRFGQAPIAGPGSLGEYAAVASGVAAALAVVAGRYVIRDRSTPRPVRFLEVVDVAAIAFAHAVIAVLTWTLLAVIMQKGFIGATVFGFSVILLAGVAAAVSAYFAFFSATHLTLPLLAGILAAFLVEGVITSTLTASDVNWWKENLSALGMNNDFSSWAFNITLIVSGILVTTLARYATQGVPTPNPKGIGRVRLCLVLIGVFLGCVGVFPVDEFFWVHNCVASGMAVVYIVLVFRLHRWIPGLARAFRMLGYLFVAVVVVVAVFFATGLYTLTAVELIAGLLIFSWIILFIRNAAALEADHSAPARERDAAVSAAVS